MLEADLLIADDLVQPYLSNGVVVFTTLTFLQSWDSPG